MDNKEAMHILREMLPLQEDANKRIALHKGITALEEADKYRWHDLRKNPADLPELEKDVLVCCISNNYFIHSLIDRGDAENGTYLCWEDAYGYFVELENVIAWKEIEEIDYDENID